MTYREVYVSFGLRVVVLRALLCDKTIWLTTCFFTLMMQRCAGKLTPQASVLVQTST